MNPLYNYAWYPPPAGGPYLPGGLYYGIPAGVPPPAPMPPSAPMHQPYARAPTQQNPQPAPTHRPAAIPQPYPGAPPQQKLSQAPMHPVYTVAPQQQMPSWQNPSVSQILRNYQQASTQQAVRNDPQVHVGRGVYLSESVARHYRTQSLPQNLLQPARSCATQPAPAQQMGPPPPPGSSHQYQPLQYYYAESTQLSAPRKASPFSSTFSQHQLHRPLHPPARPPSAPAGYTQVHRCSICGNARGQKYQQRHPIVPGGMLLWGVCSKCKKDAVAVVPGDDDDYTARGRRRRSDSHTINFSQNYGKLRIRVSGGSEKEQSAVEQPKPLAWLSDSISGEYMTPISSHNDHSKIRYSHRRRSSTRRRSPDGGYKPGWIRSESWNSTSGVVGTPHVHFGTELTSARQRRARLNTSPTAGIKRTLTYENIAHLEALDSEYGDGDGDRSETPGTPGTSGTSGIGTVDNSYSSHGNNYGYFDPYRNISPSASNIQESKKPQQAVAERESDRLATQFRDLRMFRNYLSTDSRTGSSQTYRPPYVRGESDTDLTVVEESTLAKGTTKGGHRTRKAAEKGRFWDGGKEV